MNRTPKLLDYPDGWYAVTFAEELKPGEVLTRRFVGEDRVLFRTESGIAAMFDPFCPHLGAHFGHGGRVVGEALRCPFHAFTFDVQGQCVATGYHSNPPPKASVRSWPLHEVNGLLLAYYGEENAVPDWHVPELEQDDWSPLIGRTWQLHSHPQETSENSVDLGHLMVVHGYENVEILSEPRMDGPYMTVGYRMKRPIEHLPISFDAHFTIHLYGLGYSLVEVFIDSLGIQTRQFVLATPLAPGQIDLRIALSMRRFGRRHKSNGPLRILPLALSNRLMPRLLLSGYAHDVQQDFSIWEHKTYVSPPILAEGDGPVGKYRYWVRQFYAGNYAMDSR